MPYICFPTYYFFAFIVFILFLNYHREGSAKMEVFVPTFKGAKITGVSATCANICVGWKTQNQVRQADLIAEMTRTYISAGTRSAC